MINSPKELLTALTDIFPEYVFEQDEYDSPDFNYHRLLGDFRVFYGCTSSTCSERQLKDLGALINAAVNAGGDIENAFGTCFLEHLGNRKWSTSRKALTPFLSKDAKHRLHA